MNSGCVPLWFPRYNVCIYIYIYTMHIFKNLMDEWIGSGVTIGKSLLGFSVWVLQLDSWCVEAFRMWWSNRVKSPRHHPFLASVCETVCNWLDCKRSYFWFIYCIELNKGKNDKKAENPVTIRCSGVCVFPSLHAFSDFHQEGNILFPGRIPWKYVAVDGRNPAPLDR